MNIAVIPARGGSKRIPRKNIRSFSGKPMIAWSILAAQQSGCFEQILVSTDDPEIADIAQRYGATIPFLRPKALADDHASTVAVVQHATEWLNRQETKPELICCVYATAPFIRADDIHAARALLNNDKDANYAFAATAFSYPIQRALQLDAHQHVTMLHPEHLVTRTQDLTPHYHDAGQFYWGKTAAWLSAQPILGPASLAHILPSYRVQDIDTEEDWTRAEILFRILNSHP